VDSPNAKKMRLTSDINVENIKPSQSVELTKNDVSVISDVANSLKSLSENFRFVVWIIFNLIRNEVSKQEALPYPINSKQFSVYPMTSFVEKGRTDLMRFFFKIAKIDFFFKK
jgi:hypothetical protein